MRYIIPILAILIVPSSSEAQRIVPEDWHNYYLRSIPDSTDNYLQKLRSSNIEFYDRIAMPLAYQELSGVHNPDYNVSQTQPLRNANKEFPWLLPAGTHPGDGSEHYNFIIIPPDMKIQVNQFSGTILWDFPVGTVLGEVIQIVNPRTKNRYTIIVRTRTRQTNDWQPAEYRPYVTASQLPINYYSRQPILRHLFSNHPNKTVFNRTASIDILPPASDTEVINLLKTPFQRVPTDISWIGDNCYGPTSNQDFHIVPYKYDGAFLPVSKNACITCHDSVLKRARDFDFNRDWYGRVRGGGNVNEVGIFSWHPFDPSCISNNGAALTPILREILMPYLVHNPDLRSIK